MASALVDPYNRTVRDLRISITDRCNFRCQYCMPEEGMKWLPREDLLTYEELTRVATVCVRPVRLREHPPHGRRTDGAGPPAGPDPPASPPWASTWP